MHAPGGDDSKSAHGLFVNGVDFVAVVGNVADEFFDGEGGVDSFYLGRSGTCPTIQKHHGADGAALGADDLRELACEQFDGELAVGTGSGDVAFELGEVAR